MSAPSPRLGLRAQGAAFALGLFLVVGAAAGHARPVSASDGADNAPPPGRQLPDRPFGPWDAGERREVHRQGQKGIDRVHHPIVGDVSKVPGDGPPPPPLRPDPDVPETALHGVNDIGGAGLSSNPLYLPYLFYSKLFTKVDGPRCAHLPTCSRFASQAVARHGVLGLLMGLDRIIQPPESSSVRTLPQVEGWGVVRNLDPVSNYEFWKSDRFTGLALPADEEPLALPSLEDNEEQNGKGALPPPTPVRAEES